MPIVLKYGAPAPILTAGFAGGVGRRLQSQQDDALRLWQQGQQQNFQAQQQEANRKQQAALQGTALDFQAKQADLRRTFDAGMTEKELTARSREGALNRERDVHLETMEGLRRGELELPEGAKRKLAQLDAGLVESLKLGPAQQAEFRAKYEAEKRALMNLASPRKEMTYDERVKSNLGANYEQFKNLPWQFNGQGEMALPSGFKMPGDAEAEQQKKYGDSVMKRFENLRTETNPETGAAIYSSDDEAAQAAIKAQDAIEKALRERGGQVQQPAAAQPQPTPGISSQIGAARQRMTAAQGAYAGGRMGLPAATSATGNIGPLGPDRPPAAAVSRAVAAQFNTQYSKLRIGQAIRGPDGKVYIKRE